MTAGATADLKTTVALQPSRSHIFLVAASFVPAAFTIGSIVLMFQGNNQGGVTLAIASLLTLAGLGYLWKSSHANQDLGDATPLTITAPNGAQVTADARTVRDLETLTQVAQLFGNIATIQPLPPPAGLMGSDGVLLSGTAVEAQARAEDINKQVQMACNEVLDAAGLSINDANRYALVQQGSVGGPVDSNKSSSATSPDGN